VAGVKMVLESGRPRPVGAERASKFGRLTALVAVTAVLYLLDAAALTCGALLRTSGTNAPWVLAGLAVCAVALAVYPVVRGPRFGKAEATAMLALQMLGIALMSRTTQLDLGALSDGFEVSMLGAYAAWLLGRPGAVVYYAGLSLWVTALIPRENLYLSVAGALFAAQAVVTTEVVRTLRNRVRRLTHTDPLTGVLNRRGIEDAVRELMRSGGGDGVPLCIALIDMDDLRQVNSQAGHLAGDALLIAATQEWRDGFRHTPVKVGRIGGDEFVLLFPGIEEGGARDTLGSLESAASVRWTAGVAMLRPGETFSEALARADAEMYARKATKEDTTRR
jgi:diguanylate cyclase (GGDEF)-like protein